MTGHRQPEDLEKVAASHARKMAQQRERRRGEVRIDYRPSRAAQRILDYYRRQGLPIDAIIDTLIESAGVPEVRRDPERFRKLECGNGS